MPTFGSDIAVQLLDHLGIRYMSLNPGASLRGLHDSLVHQKSPEMVLATNEVVAVSIAHGYAKAAGEPMAVGLHDLVGLQSGSLGIYNAWADLVPMMVIGGTGPADAAQRRPWIDWLHATRSHGLQVRDYVKWDDEPVSPKAMVSSLLRASQIANTSPQGPTFVGLDVLLQEQLVDDSLLSSIAVAAPSRLTAPSADLEQLADRVVAAERPVILADFVGRSEAGYRALIALAELLAAPVVDLGSRHNFPSDHWADGTNHHRNLLADTDLVVALDLRDVRWATSEIDIENHGSRDLLSPGTPIVGMSLNQLMHRGFNDREDIVDSELMLVADTEVALPELVELVRRRVSDRSARRDALVARLDPFPSFESIDDHRGPLTRTALASALAPAIREGPWQLAHGILGGAARRAWPFADYNCYLGYSGGGGLGYGLGATVGAALAHRDDDTLVVDLQPDGDFLYTASALWTAAHHRLAALFVVVNNRTYGKDRLHQATVARLRGRPVPEPSPGIDLDDPCIDFAALAAAQGVEGIGPIDSAAELSTSLARAASVVRNERRSVVVEVVVDRES
jgi:benzoylformate decarboxylase/acetolactate synthase-1/2/3 large subunit